MILSNTFRVSMDVLLKDELKLNEVKDIHSCGSNAVKKKKQELYEGVLIKESIVDDSIIDCLNIHKHAGMELEKLHQYDIVYLCGGNTHYLLERINATGFHKSLMAYINGNGLVIGVSAGSLIFSNNLDDNLGLINTKLDVHCATGEKRGKLAYPLKSNIKLTNTCALVIRDYPNGMEIIG
ncbi:MAG: Type 1 glutamine amidotransferase-like domain-containing protein [Ruminococcus flavefaciens]|nr:Type 1 glutamine amidotransferase-like domain-containing protein [Ruminococcus flavefaciens]